MSGEHNGNMHAAAGGGSSRGGVPPGGGGRNHGNGGGGSGGGGGNGGGGGRGRRRGRGGNDDRPSDERARGGTGGQSRQRDGNAGEARTQREGRGPRPKDRSGKPQPSSKDRSGGKDRSGNKSTSGNAGQRSSKERAKDSVVATRELSQPTEKALREPVPAAGNFRHEIRRYGLMLYENFAAAKADLVQLREMASKYDQLNIVIRADGNMDDPELTALGNVKVFAGTAWTLIHERRRTDGWYDEPR